MPAVERPVVLATICARAGSKGIPNKNLRSLAGRPLVRYAIECAQACPDVDRIVVSTDSDEIARIAESAGIPVPFRRPAELASDTAAKIGAIRHAVEFAEEREGFAPEIVVDLDIGVPMRRPEDISRCVRELWAHADLDAVVTLYEAERNPYFNMVEFHGEQIRLVARTGENYVCRQDAPRVYSVSPAVFAWRRGSLWVSHLFEGEWGGILIPRDRAVDIDEEYDFELVEWLMSRRRTEVDNELPT